MITNKNNLWSVTDDKLLNYINLKVLVSVKVQNIYQQPFRNICHKTSLSQQIYNYKICFMC